MHVRKRKPTRGGARKGAGRKPVHGERARITVEMPIDLLRWLDAAIDDPLVGALSRNHLIVSTLQAYRDEVESFAARPT
jgi:hypothetical protein